MRLPVVATSLAFFAVLLGAAVPGHADEVIVLSGADFSGPTNNTGGNITVTIQDLGSGDVAVTVANNLVDPGAFLGSLYLNTTAAPLSSPSAACVNCSAINVGVGADPGVFFGNDSFQADGDGRYDILFDPSNDEANRLTPGESVTFNILTSSAGFTAASFLTLAAPGGGHGPFIAAAHIQALPPNAGQSDWIAGNPPVSAVPEPGTLTLIGSGLVALGTAVRRRKR